MSFVGLLSITSASTTQQDCVASPAQTWPSAAMQLAACGGMTAAESAAVGPDCVRLWSLVRVDDGTILSIVPARHYLTRSHALSLCKSVVAQHEPPVCHRHPRPSFLFRLTQRHVRIQLSPRGVVCDWLVTCSNAHVVHHRLAYSSTRTALA